MVVFFLFDIIVWIALGPNPVNAESWFTLLQSKKLIGLSLLSFPTHIGMILYYLTFFGLYSILKQANEAYAGLAAIFSFVGLAIVIGMNMAYPIAYLSNQYAAATTESQKILILAAGEAKIASANTGMNMGGLFVEIAAVIFSLLMLRSNVFGKMTAYLGIMGHGLDLTRIIMILAFLPEGIGAILLMIGGLPQLIWLILVGRKFMQLGLSKSVDSQTI